MSLSIAGPAGPLEAQLWEPEGTPRAAAVVCHPHPAHGGTMNSSVVFRAARGLQAAGLAVLRFNFRGVGGSAGGFDGRGGEERDLSAALDFLARRWPALELWAGGFSFGARTAAGLALSDERIRHLLLIALPVSTYPLDELTSLERPGLVLMAGRDDFGSLGELEQRFPGWRSRMQLEEIPGADHFFRGQAPELEARVKSWAENTRTENTI